MHEIGWKIFEVILILAFITLMGGKFGFGPVLWARRSSGRKRAEEGTERRELVARVQKLLPQADDSNVLYSMYKETHTSGGSKVSVTTYTYYSRVFVIDGERIWMIPVNYDRKRRSYELGSPAVIPEEAVKGVNLSGKRDKSLTYTFWIDMDKRTLPLQMVVEPFCFRRNSFYPFNLLQQTACDKAVKAAEDLARRACGMSPEDLENDRLKNLGTGYGFYAGCLGFIGVLCATGQLLPATIILFAIALVMLGLMIVNKRIPKLSAVVVIVEILAAWWVSQGMS